MDRFATVELREPLGVDAPRRGALACALLAIALAASAGCMQRRMTIVSNPPGATAYVDGVEIGKTPVSHDFIYYGTREIRLVHDGYKTLTLLQPMSTPWYQVPPLDFFSDNLAFGEIHDARVYRYDMQPAVQEPFDNIVERGEQLRRGSVAPATAIGSPAIGTGAVGTPTITYPPPGGSAGTAPPVGVPALQPGFATPGSENADSFIPPGQAPGRPSRSWPTPN
ncbi:MAG: PEGA domain-containing protein [Pirellulales bacterium]